MSTVNGSANHHSLSEILVRPHLTAEERVKTAAQRAPFLVTALAVHAILAAILGMVYLHKDAKREERDAPTIGHISEVDAPKIEENLAEPPKEIERSAIPEVSDAALASADPDAFFYNTDDRIREHANEAGKFGVTEGDEDNHNEDFSMSRGGWGRATAIGLGSNGGHAGGGAPKGRPFAGNIRRDFYLRQKGDPRTPRIDAGLGWLARHQSPDGSWDCDGFTACCDGKGGPACTGRGQATFDSGVTGLALLALLGAGYDGSTESLNDLAVRRGLKWLRDSQDAQGCFGPRGDPRYTYSHACATIAMCEAASFTKNPIWRRSAQRGADYIAACQNPYKAWRYGEKPGDNDASVTGWMIMALKAAKDAGLTINERTILDGLAFIDSMTDEDTGRTGYTKKGELPVRPEGGTAKWPAAQSESLTAVGLCSRIFTGKADQNPMVKAGAALLSKKLPVWDEASGSIDMYYWYYGTLAMYQLGGDNWARWNKNLESIVIEHQVKAGCAAGSYDPIDPWSDEGGRVYSTALMTLCYEVYVRYPKVFGAKAVVERK